MKLIKDGWGLPNELVKYNSRSEKNLKQAGKSKEC